MMHCIIAKERLLLLCGFFLAILVSFTTVFDQDAEPGRYTSTTSSTKSKGLKTKLMPKEETSEQQALDDGCGLVNDTLSSHWKPATKEEITDLGQVAQCLNKLKRRIPITGRINPVRPGFVSNHTLKLDCQTKITLRNLQSTLAQHDTLWFIGDSVLMQQYYALICMVDPTLSSLVSDGSKRMGQKTSSSHNLHWHNKKTPISQSFQWKQPNGRQTRFLFSQFGLKFKELHDENLYQGAFPLAIKALTQKDAIIMDASNHYDANSSQKLKRAISFIAQQSIQSKASVYLMEPNLEEWPTSNGIHVHPCKDANCKCEVVDSMRLVGRGNFSNAANLFGNQLKFSPAPTITPILQKLYPDLAFAKDSQNCLPDCLPATWRTDVARHVLSLSFPHASDHPSIAMVPTFWQLVAKGSPSGRGAGRRPNVGDCTHKSLDAILAMNEQLVRTIMKRIQQDDDQQDQILFA